MMCAFREFDLNIERVLENWTVAHAVREIIANALDEQLITHSLDIEIYKDSNGLWHIRDFGRGLRYVHLTQNENEEKLCHPNLIGKFGVGLKDALATFDRHNVTVSIESRFGHITFGQAAKHGFSDVVTLHAYIAQPHDECFVGTEFILQGCSDDDVRIAKGFFLRFSDMHLYENTQYGAVYSKRNGISEIFINGIKVSEEENLLFTYNITSLNATLRKALNRERTNVGRAAYSERIKSILLSVKSNDVVHALTTSLFQMSAGRQCDEMRWIDVQTHVIKLLNARDNAVFVTPEEIEESDGNILEIIKGSGKKTVFIPESVKQKIENAKDINGNSISTIRTVIESYNRSFEYEFLSDLELDANEKVIYDLIPFVIKLVGSEIKPSQIFISTKLCQSEDGSTQGIWDHNHQRIVILRTQLRNREGFLGTLIHELTHADTGCADVSRRFENALTQRLGMLADKLLAYETIAGSEIDQIALGGVSGDVIENQHDGATVLKCSRASSLIDGLIYDRRSQSLFVKIRNNLYRYENVPECVAERMFVAPSIGRFFNSNIRDYKCSFVLEDEYNNILAKAEEYIIQ